MTSGSFCVKNTNLWPKWDFRNIFLEHWFCDFLHRTPHVLSLHVLKNHVNVHHQNNSFFKILLFFNFIFLLEAYAFRSQNAFPLFVFFLPFVYFPSAPVIYRLLLHGRCILLLSTNIPSSIHRFPGSLYFGNPQILQLHS